MLFWAVIVLWSSTIYDYKGMYGPIFILFNLIRLPVIMLATYLVLYGLIPKYLIQSRQYQKFGLWFVLILLVATLLDRVIIGSDLLAPQLEEAGLTYRFFNEVPILRNAFLLISIMGLASMIRFFKLFIHQERHRNEIQKEKLATELAFLKAQVNPHFLFNALNNLYSMAIQKDQTELAGGLENLSGIMHYLTYESNAEKVDIEKEILLIQHYIEIQSLRLSETDDATIAFHIDGSTKGVRIAPVLLLPLVENAFKHGVEPDKKSLVKIDLLIEGNTLIFTIKNTIRQSQVQDLGKEGIGLKNVRKRLDLLYPEAHRFDMKREGSYFIITLSLTF